MNVDNWSPIPIGWVDNPKHDKIKDKLINLCEEISKEKKDEKDWVAQGVYTSLHHLDVYRESKFDSLNIWVDRMLSEFKKKVDIKNDIECASAWFNIYHKYDYQEFHQHADNDLSCVYFLKSKVNGPKLVFENWNSHYFTLKSGFDNFAHRFFYESIEGRLLIFPSQLRHCVEQNLFDDTRISIAYNYREIK